MKKNQPSTKAKPIDASPLARTAIPAEGWGGADDAHEVRLMASDGDVCLKARRPGDADGGYERDVWLTARAARDLAALLLLGADVAEDKLAFSIAYGRPRGHKEVSEAVLAQAKEYAAQLVAGRVRSE